MSSFGDFLNKFFELFVGKSFRGGDYLSYLNRSIERRSGDEASIVDTAIVGPLLGLLGFEPAERMYNQQRQNDRPDFAPADALYGTCFVVEDKSTSLPLSFNLADPNSHLSQLARYMRSINVRLGCLTNGKQFTLWRFDKSNELTKIVDIDLPAAIVEWSRYDSHTLPPSLEKSLRDLFDLCRKESFTDPQRLEHELAIDLDEWQIYALPLGRGTAYKSTLVESLQSLVKELQADARRVLDRHLTRYEAYMNKINRLTDDALDPAAQHFKELRSRVISILDGSFKLVWGLETEDIVAIEDILVKLEQDARLFVSPQELLKQILDVLNTARQRKYPHKSRAAIMITGPT